MNTTTLSSDTRLVRDLTIEQLVYVIDRAVEGSLVKHLGRSAPIDEAPTIRGKNNMRKHLGIGREVFDSLYSSGVFEGVILSTEGSRTYTAQPEKLRERYTAYCTGEYQPVARRSFRPKNRV